jgi:S-adenosylmethionine synthetase
VELAPARDEPAPVSFLVTTAEGADARQAEIAAALREEFDLTPAGIMARLDLKRPIYYPTAAYGHFGREDLDLPWEETQ